MKFHRLVLCLVLLNFISARPWSPENEKNSIEVVSQSTSPLMTTIDSVSNNLARSLKQLSPNVTPVLSGATVGYIVYIASVMFFPRILSDVGIPLLQDFKFEVKSKRNQEAGGFIDSIASGIFKDMIGRTEAADVFKNTSVHAVEDGLKTFRKTARMVNIGLTSAQGIIGRVLTFLKSDCMLRYLCQVGQFTSRQFPIVGPILRSINTIDFDDYSQALIDGTTIGDCSAVFHQCPL